jgi:hypothetical protein
MTRRDAGILVDERWLRRSGVPVLRWRLGLALLIALVMSLSLERLAAADLADELAAIRGANYTPSYASTSVGAWLHYDADVVERELAYAQRLRLNSVRVFLSTVAYEHDPPVFAKNVADLVARCHAHQLRPLFVLFDSCFGLEPSLELANSETWVNNPGFSRLGQESWPALENYVRTVVQPLCGDERVLGWDIMNEPMADFEHVTRAERDVIWEFVRHFCRFVKEIDPQHPITVGHAAAEYIPRTSHLVDFVSLHSYSPRESWFRADIDLARRYGAEQGKPMVITECGSPGFGQPYPLVIRVAGEERVGFYLWELMIGKIMFRDSQGVIYPDGTTRDPETVAALLGFFLNTDGVPLKAVPDLKPLEEQVEQRQRWPELLQQAEAVPRTAAGITPLVVTLATVARAAARPSGDAAECFELGLSIPHLFRLGKEADAIAGYERLLQLARRWMVAE